MSRQDPTLLPVFCAHLDTVGRMRNPWSYCAELVLTRLYFGPLALTDTMLLDTAGLRAAYDDPRTRGILEALFWGDNVVCLRRKNVKSFHDVLGKMAHSRMIFSSLPKIIQNRALEKVEEKDALRDAGEKFIRALPPPTRKSFITYLQWLDNLSSGRTLRIAEWPTVRPLARRVAIHIADADPLELEKFNARDLSYLTKFRSEIERPENYTKDRSWMWRRLGFDSETGRPKQKPTSVQTLCRSFVDESYLSSFPDALGWRSTGRTKLNVGRFTTGAVRRLLWQQLLPTWEQNYGTPANADWNVDLHYRQILLTMAQVATEISPFSSRIESSDNPVKTWIEFQKELQDECESRLRQKLDQLEPPIWMEDLTKRMHYAGSAGAAGAMVIGSGALLFLKVSPHLIETVKQLGIFAGIGGAYGAIAALSRRTLEAPYMFCSRFWTDITTRRKLRQLIPQVWNAARGRRRS